MVNRKVFNGHKVTKMHKEHKAFLSAFASLWQIRGNRKSEAGIPFETIMDQLQYLVYKLFFRRTRNAATMNLHSTDTDLTALRQAAKQHALQLFQLHYDPSLKYHNLKHTENVVEKALTIAHHYELNEPDRTILEIAAWFHDTGHLCSPSLGHEEVGVSRFNAFLNNYPIPYQDAHRVASCILSTKMPQEPVTFLEAIICDADTYHLGTPEFIITDALLREEVTIRTGSIQPFWELKSLELLRTHRYHTFYCHCLLESGKAMNYKNYLEKIRIIAKDKTLTDPSSHPVYASRVW